MKKSIFLSAICLLLVLFFLYSCANSNSDSIALNNSANKSENKISSPIDAKYAFLTYPGLPRLIVGNLHWEGVDLINYNQPQFGDTSFSDDGSVYTITAKGNISGYTDDYLTKYERVKFEVKATVNKSDGTVHILKVTPEK